MLDFVLGKRLYDKILSDRKYRNKFRTFFLRESIFLSILCWIVFAIMILWIYHDSGELVQAVQIVMLVILQMLISCVVPIMQWKIWSK